MKLPIEQRIWHHVKDAFGDLTTDRTKRDKVHFKRKIFRGLEACKKDLADHFKLAAGDLQCFYTDTNKKTKNTEYMGFDFTWTTYPTGRQFHYKINEMKLPASKYQILLAAESEAAASNSGLKTFANKVLEDFIKLLDVKCRLKLMVYRPPLSHLEEGFDIVRAAFQDLIDRHQYRDKSETWMFIGIPWYRKKFPRFGPTCHRVHLLSLKGGAKLVAPPWPW